MHQFFTPPPPVYRPFILEIDTTLPGSASNTFVIPLVPSLSYNFFVHWGDGTSEKVTSSTDVTHVYPAAGVYTVKIYGRGNGLKFPHIYFNNSGDRQKLIRILQWGDIFWASFVYSFRGCSNLMQLPRDRPYMSQVVSAVGTFSACTNLNDNLASFNTESVTNFLSILSSSSTFNQPVLFNTVNATTFDSMFAVCTAFNQPIAFNSAKCASFRQMFLNCSAFKQDLSGLDIRSLTNATSMLQGTDINDTGTTTRYDALLNSWASQAFQPNVVFHGGTAQYSSAASAARNALVAAGWTITDGGLA